MIPRYFVIAERDHEIQNPTSEEKLRLLGRRLRLVPGSHALDVASGRGGPAVLLAGEFGCAVDGIEIRLEFHAVAVQRAASAGLAGRVTFELANASEATFTHETYDVAMCLGASFVLAACPERWTRSSRSCARVATSSSASPTGGSGRSRGTTRIEANSLRRSKAP